MFANRSGHARCLSVLFVTACLICADLRAEFPNFEYHMIDRIGQQMGQTSLVDIDKDGDLDWVVGQRTKTWWFEYDGPDKWIRHDLGQGVRTDVGGTAFDIDGDGWIDQFCGTGWYRNTGKPRTETFERFDSGTIDCHDNVAADINGDGKLDAVAISDQKAHKVTVWYRRPTKSLCGMRFPPIPATSGSSTRSAAASTVASARRVSGTSMQTVTMMSFAETCGSRTPTARVSNGSNARA